jgi:hypothetical protein
MIRISFNYKSCIYFNIKKNHATFLQHGFPNQPKSKPIFLLLLLPLFLL